jgi:glycosyltransferase involved in cell wall biosynthesis
MKTLSIITINLNNAAGLQKTMQTVFVQSFKDFEYIVIDGESKDGSVALIEKYKDRLSYWVSESDTSVYNAMNKGVQKATGDYLLFLNSGDYLVDENILAKVSKELDGSGIVYGNVFLIESPSRSWTGHYPDTLSFQHFVDGSLPHPGSFIKRTVFDEVGYYDESLKIVADWKFFLDAICKFNISYKHIDLTVSVFLLDGLSSLSANKDKVQEEKNSVFSNEYAAFMENSKELNQLRAFKNNRLVLRFTKMAKAIGLLKGVEC